jgi:hypothetical protein
MPAKKSAVSASLFGLACLLQACASNVPMSLMKGVPETATDFTLVPVRIIAIDQEMMFRNQTQWINVAPGIHSLVLQADPPQRAHTAKQRVYMFRVAPCTRYELAAKFDSPLLDRWDLVLDSTETISACNPEEELKKAGISAPVTGNSTSNTAKKQEGGEKQP